MEIIRLKRLKNYRDLGGIKTVDGKTIRPHMLIRGTTLFAPTVLGIKILKEKYNLKTIVDLRTQKELLEKPDALIEGVEIIHMPVITEAVAGISHEKKVHSMKSLIMMPRMEDLYVSMVTEESLDNVVKILRFILTLPIDKYSVVFHCTAGKDRTGVIAALLLSFLGVDRATVIHDYLLTNKNVQFKANMAYIGLLLTRGNHKLAHKIKHYFMAEPDFIKASLNQLEKDFGSLNEFFKQKLAFTQEEEKEIKDKFLRDLSTSSGTAEDKKMAIITPKRSDYISWDEYFMGVAKLAGFRSKDPNSQVGACIVSEDNKILSMGYNGFPRGCSDDEFPWAREGDTLETKYAYVCHSELNAILNYRGGSLEGCKIYVTLFPCNECAKAIIQSGIKTVVYADNKYDGTPSVEASKRLMNAAGVRYYKYEPTGRRLEIDV